MLPNPHNGKQKARLGIRCAVAALSVARRADETSAFHPFNTALAASDTSETACGVRR